VQFFHVFGNNTSVITISYRLKGQMTKYKKKLFEEIAAEDSQMN